MVSNVALFLSDEPLTKGEARPIAANVAKLSEFLRKS
jgi:hypothetical protein